jgi:hypothetical protein
MAAESSQPLLVAGVAKPTLLPGGVAGMKGENIIIEVGTDQLSVVPEPEWWILIDKMTE